MITYLLCSCGKRFSKYEREHKRSLRLKKQEYCSLKCSGKFRENPFKGKGRHQRDEFSDFRYYERKARFRNKNSTITLQELKAQWEKQKGKCAYLKIKLEHT